MNVTHLLLILALALPLRAQQWRAQELPDPAGVHVDDWFFVDANGDGSKDVLWIDLRAGSVALQLAPFAAPAQPTKLPPGVRAFQFAEICAPEGEDLLLLHPEGVWILPGCTGSPLPWLQTPLAFAGTLKDGFACLGFGRDVDGDGHEDLLFPTRAGEMLLHRKPDGAPGILERVGPQPSIEHARGGGGLFFERLSFPRVELVAMGKNKKPMALLLERQGLCELTADGNALRTVFAFPGTPSKTFGQLERVECTIEDLEGSGVDAVLVARTRVEEARLPEPRTEIVLYRQGSSNPAGVLLLNGLLSTGPELVDLNGDGHKDMLLAVVPSGVTGELHKLAGRLPITWHVWFHSPSAMPFSRSPDFSWTDTLDAVSLERWGLRHRLLVGPDVNGDGLLDLVSVSRDGEDWVASTWLQSREGERRFLRNAESQTVLKGQVHSMSTLKTSASRALVFRKPNALVLLTHQGAH
jgi:hypothetical protein